MTRKLAFVGFSYLAGLLIGSFLVLKAAFAAGAGLFAMGTALLILFFRKMPDNILRLAVFAVSAAVGIFVYSGYDYFHRIPAEKYDGAEFNGQAVICEASCTSSGGGQYVIDCILPDDEHIRVMLYSFSEGELVRGDIITLKAALAVPDSEGFFNSKDYLSARGVYLTADDAEITGVIIKDHNIYEFFRSARERIMRSIRSVIPGESGELCIGMLFGSSFYELSESAELSLQRAGIAHAAAVSGMHMAVAAGMAALIADALGVSRRARFAAVCLSAFTFAFLADLSVSVSRSLVMIIIVYAAELINRRSDPATSLAAAVIVITLHAPYCVRSASFLLSVSGVLGSGVFAPVIIESIEKRMRRNDRKKNVLCLPLRLIITSVTAWAAVFPTTLMMFDEISVISPVTNVLLSELCSGAVAVSFAGAVLTMICGNFPLSELCFKAAGIFCNIILKAADFLGGLPFAAIPAKQDIFAPLLTAAVISVVLCALLTRSRSHTLLMMSFSLFICSVCISVCSLVPSACKRVTVLTEGKGSVIIEWNERSAVIYDLMGTKSGADAARKFLAGKGGGVPSAIILTVNTEKAAELYSERFPDSGIYIVENGCGIRSEDAVFSKEKGKSVIEIGGASIICVTSVAADTEGEYALAVLDCGGTADVSADMYVVASRRYKGEVPVSAPCVKYVTSTYILSGGKLYPEEESSIFRVG